MRVEYFEVAKEEYLEGIRNYNENSPGLGFEFAIEIEKAIVKIKNYPNAWSPFSKYTRRCRIKRFPYGILYYIESDVIYIIGIMPFHDDPRRWTDRVQSYHK